MLILVLPKLLIVLSYRLRKYTYRTLLLSFSQFLSCISFFLCKFAM